MVVKAHSAIALFTCGCLVCVASSPSNIGFVVTSGQAVIDGATVRGNSTLFQGNVVRAGDATSDLMFAGGSNLLLQPGAEVRVFREYGVLDHGTAIQRGTHVLVANGLKVSSLSPQGAVLVDIQDPSHLEVVSQSGTAEVRNQGGVLVARLEAGKALRFALQAAAPQAPAATTQQQSPTAASAQGAPPPGTQLTLHGILRKDHPGRYGHFLLTDLLSKVTYELQGPGLDDLVGASVEVTGSTFDTQPAPGAAQVISISDVHQMPLSEIQQQVPGLAPPAPPPPSTNTPAAAPPIPSGETLPPSGGPEVGATPPATAPAEEPSVPQPPPLPQHSDTAKILVIVAIAAGAAVGVALGLGGGKSSTVSPE
jgi:hypothetical protein